MIKETKILKPIISYMATGTGDFCVIPTSKSLDTPLITQRCYFEDEITNIITSKDMNE